MTAPRGTSEPDAGARRRALAAAGAGLAGAAWLCLALDLPAGPAAVLLAALAGLACWPVVGFFPGWAERTVLFAIGATLPVSLKVHLVHRAEHLGGSIGLRVSITDLLLLLLGVVALPRLAGRQVRVHVDTPILVAFGAYLAFATLSLAAGGDTALGIFQLVALLQSFLAFVVVSNALSSRVRLEAFAAGVLAGLVLQAAVAVAQARWPGALNLEFLGGVEEVQDKVVRGRIDLPAVDLGTTTIGGELTRRPTGLLIHPNVLASYFILAVPLAFAGWLVLPAAPLRLLALSGLGLGGLALYLSLSRSGWLGVAVALGLGAAAATAARAWRLTRSRKVGLALMGLAAAAGLAAGADRIARRFTETAGEAFDFRRDLGAAAWKMALEHPITGVGLNTFVDVVRDYDESGVSRLKLFPVHNIYLLELSETGMAGGLAFAALVATLVWRTLRAARACASRGARLLALFLAASLVGFWLAEVGDFVYRIPILTTLVWVQVGLVFAVSRLGGALEAPAAS